MFKMCEKCGFMYDDSCGGCPQCNNGETTQNIENTNNVGSLQDLVNNTQASPGSYNENENSNFQSTVDKAKDIYKDKAEPFVKDTIIPFFKDKVLPFLKKNKKTVIGIPVGIISAALVAVIIYFVVTSIRIKAPVEVNTTQYISNEVFTQEEITAYYEKNDSENYNNDNYEYYGSEYRYSNAPYGSGLIVRGYNNMGYVDETMLYNIIDWEAFVSDIDEQLSKKERINTYTPEFYDVFSSESSFEFKLSEETKKLNGKLKNGDVVEIEFNISQAGYIEAFECNGGSGTATFTIEGLKDVAAFDPFDYVNFVQMGANSFGAAQLRVSKELNEALPNADGFKVCYYDDETISLEQNDYIIGKIKFFFDNTYTGSYSNGDKVWAFCTTIDNLTEDYNLYISKHEKEYTFDSLGEYITKSSTISQADLDIFKAYAEEYINGNHNITNGSVTFDSVYVVDSKDLTTSSKFHNGLCFVYSYVYKGFLSTPKTKYLYVSYENLIADKDGVITQTPEEYFKKSSKGYSSTEDLLNSVYNSDYNIVKVQ